MTREEFIAENGVSESALLLEPWEDFSKGILGVSDDGNHVIYGYNKLVEALTDCDSDKDEQAAVDWIEYNTIRSLMYVSADYRPIICRELID